MSSLILELKECVDRLDKLNEDINNKVIEPQNGFDKLVDEEQRILNIVYTYFHPELKEKIEEELNEKKSNEKMDS